MTVKVNGAELKALAASVNPNAQIWDVRVLRLAAETSDDWVEGTLTANVEVSTLASQTGAEIEVRALYAVSARSEGGDETAAVDAWRVDVELVASFEVDEGRAFNDAQLSAFAISTGIMAIHPFARELVHNTTARLGYPPYTMEFMRSSLELFGDTDEYELVASDADVANIRVGLTPDSVDEPR